MVDSMQLNDRPAKIRLRLGVHQLSMQLGRQLSGQLGEMVGDRLGRRLGMQLVMHLHRMVQDD